MQSKEEYKNIIKESNKHQLSLYNRNYIFYYAGVIWMTVFVTLNYKKEMPQNRIERILYGIKGTKEVHFNEIDNANIEIFADWIDVQPKLAEIKRMLDLSDRDIIRSEILTPA